MTSASTEPGESTDSDDTDGSEAHASAPEAQPQRRRAAAITVVLLVVALIAATVLAVVWGLKLHHKNQVANAEAAALEAARIDAVYLTSYDYRTLTDDFANVERNATPSFRQKFQQSGSLLRPALAKDQASAKGTVKAAAISSGTTSRVVVLAFVDQNVLTPGSAQPRSVTTRLELTMVNSHGHWLMDDVRLV
jgi:Mce-associated membrane protein